MLLEKMEMFQLLSMVEKMKIKNSISKKLLKTLIEKENFLSNIITLNIDGKPQNVLPREVKYHILTDEPTHVDFLRVLPGVKITIEVPVNFINHDKSPGLKKRWSFEHS